MLQQCPHDIVVKSLSRPQESCGAGIQQIIFEPAAVPVPAGLKHVQLMIRVDACIQQSMHQPQRCRFPISRIAVWSASHVDGHVKRSTSPPVPRMRVGTLVQQVLGNFKVRVVDGHHERCHPIRIRQIDVGATHQQGLDTPTASRASCVKERCEAARRTILNAGLRGHLISPVVGSSSYVDGGAFGNQERYHFRMVLGGGPHQCRLFTKLFRRIDVGAMADQKFGNFHHSGSRRQHDRRLSILIGPVCIGPRIQKHSDEVHIGDSDGLRQRARSIGIDDVRPGTAAQQRLDQFLIYAVHRPMQWRRSVGLRAVYGGVPRNHLERCLTISGFNAIGERALRLSERGQCCGRQRTG